MPRVTTFALALLAAAALSAAALASTPASPAPAHQHAQAPKNPIAALHWRHGPTTATLGSRATLKIPAGFAYLGPAGARKFMKLNQNPIGSESHYILVSQSASWFVDFSFDPVGYVKDHQTINAKDILASLRRSDARGNKARAKRGWASLTLIGWQTPPHYNKATHRLEWATLLKSQGQTFCNYKTRILGRHGVMDAILVDDPVRLSADEATFNHLLRGFRYNASEKYSAYRSGDKVAEYGLAALITGGTVAVAAKTGLIALIIAKLVAMWKLLLAGLVAVGGFIAKVFGFSKKQRKAAKQARGLATGPPEPADK